MTENQLACLFFATPALALAAIFSLVHAWPAVSGAGRRLAAQVAGEHPHVFLFSMSVGLAFADAVLIAWSLA